MTSRTHAHQATCSPNHHAHHPGFSGLGGALAGLSMLARKRDDSGLASGIVGLTATDRLVDVGSGPGASTRAAARVATSVTGVEPAAVMRRLARATTPPWLGIRWIEGTAEALPLDDATATVVWSLATVHHWADIERGLAEVHRVLAPGGRFLALERDVAPGATGLASHGWTNAQAEAFADACRAAGFADVVVAEQSTHRGPAWSVLARRP